jgi:hypothetical protein
VLSYTSYTINDNLKGAFEYTYLSHMSATRLATWFRCFGGELFGAAASLIRVSLGTEIGSDAESARGNFLKPWSVPDAQPAAGPPAQ